MSENIDETKQDVHGLQNLPEDKRKETEEILSEIQKDEDEKNPKPKENEKPQKSEEELKKEEEAKAEADKQKLEDDKTKTGNEDSKDKLPRRDSKLVPSYLLGIEKTKAENREKELLKEIEALKTGAKTDGNDKKEIPKVEIKALVDKIVADNNVEDPKVISDIMDAVDAYLKDKTQIPPEIMEKLKVVDDLKNQHEIALEEINFSNDFDKIVLPAIKAEYGDDVPAEKIAEIKAKLKEVAYTNEYAKVPYDEIYSGKKDFRNLYTPKKRSAEGVHGSNLDLKSGKKVFDTELTTEEYNKLPPEDQQQYEDTMANKERHQ